MPEKFEFAADASQTLRAYDQMEKADKDFLRQMQKTINAQAAGAKDAITKMQGMERQTKKLQRENERLKKAVDGVAAANRKSFGSQALADMKSMVASYTGIAGAVGMITKALGDMQAARKEAAQTAMLNETGISGLFTLAGTGPEAQQLVGRAQELFKAGGGLTEGEAANLAFQLNSAGITDKPTQMMFAKSKGIIADPIEMAKRSNQLRKAFGASEAGSIRDVVNKGVAAANLSPVGPEELLTGAAKAGVGAEALGFRDEAILAATGVAAEPLGGASEAGTAIRALQKAFLRQGGFKGKGLVGAINKLKARGLNDQELVKFLGSDEAFAAFGILARPESQAAMRKSIQAQDAAVANDQIGQQMGFRADVPQVGAANLRRRAQATLDVSQNDIGTMNNLNAAIEALVLKKLQEDYGTGVLGSTLSGVSSFGQSMDEMLGFEEFNVRRFARKDLSGESQEYIELQKEIRDILKNLDRKNKLQGTTR